MQVLLCGLYTFSMCKARADVKIEYKIGRKVQAITVRRLEKAFCTNHLQVTERMVLGNLAMMLDYHHFPKMGVPLVA